MTARESNPPVTFDWNSREGSSWWLAGFIFLSFLMHSAAFFVFQGKPPGAARSPRTAPVVQILLPSADQSPEAGALLQWIATQDPALVARLDTIEPPGLTGIPYRPSFQVSRTQPLVNPPEPPTIQIPPARDPIGLIRSLSPPKKPAAADHTPLPTTLTFSQVLRARMTTAPSFTPEQRTDAAVQPTIFLVAVARDGEPRFTFLQQPSGSQALDSEASGRLRKLRFAAGDTDLEWGTVTFAWGDDVIGPPGKAR